MSGDEKIAAGWVRGVDASYAELTPATATKLRDAGVVVWWQCLWTGRDRPATAIANLNIARAAGMKIAAYCSVGPVNPGWWHANHARDGVADEVWDELVVVPCDVELAGIPDETIRQCVDALFDLGKRRAIYTSYGHWTGAQRDSQLFDDCLLANAMWDGDPDVDFAALPFGGWRADQVILEQYTGGELVEDVLVDRDVWNVALLNGDGSEVDMDAPTKGEFQAFFALEDDRYHAFVAIARAFVDLARHVYGDDDAKIAELAAAVAHVETMIATTAEGQK
jgi:hypothetical protein